MTKREAHAALLYVMRRFDLKAGALEVKKHKDLPGWGLYIPRKDDEVVEVDTDKLEGG